MSYSLMQHQQQTVQLYKHIPSVFDQSDAGTGKTLPALHAWAERRRNDGGRLLVFAPKSCTQAVWVAEVEKFFGSEFFASAALAPSTKRRQAFNHLYDVVVTNHDAVKWLMKQPNIDKLLANFDTLIWDESDALRHSSSRTKEALKLAARNQWQYKACLSATPFNKSVSELFYQVKFLDGGVLLGSSFFKFRSTICDPIQIGPSANHIQWFDKPHAAEAVAGIIGSISIRHTLDQCSDIPDITHRYLEIDLPPKLMAAYNALKRSAVLQLKSDEAIGINAATLANKLLQLCSGSIYGSEKAHLVDTSRYELAVQLAKEALPSIIFFNYAHQKDALIQEINKYGLTYQFIDGSVSTKDRTTFVKLFQSGLIDILLLQINSAAHGITLTRATRVIFTTPPYSPSTYKQAIGRIRRKGQKQKTESILLVGKKTLEPGIVDTLIDRSRKQRTLLELLE